MKKVLAILFVIAAFTSCTKDEVKKESQDTVIFVTAQAVDNDGNTTDFPVVLVHVKD